MQAAAPDSSAPDLLLLGGGLANGLLALRLSQVRPELDVRIVEAADRLGGVHTWSFFETDLTAAQRRWVAPLVAFRWPGYSVRFPSFERRLNTGYCSVTAERFAEAVTQALPGRILTDAPVVSAGRTEAVLADGRRLTARVVIDGRGPTATPDLALGFQKFIGLEMRLTAPHGLTEPIVMDACVDQVGGYRFLYVLPLDDRTLLVEDTRYTDGADLDRDLLRDGVRAYAAQKGWVIQRILREEEGVLPVALDGDIAAHLRRMGPTGVSGLRAGLFHPTTGYSLPDAVRLADHVAAHIDATLDGAVLTQDIRARARDVWAQRGFYRLLNRMLFRAARPDQRYRVLERFYRLPQPLIERFYAGETTLADKARILSGKPPVPIGAALTCLVERGHA